MRQLAAVLSLATAMIAISGCGGGGTTTTLPQSLALNSGNWLFYVNSSTSATSSYPQNTPLRGAMSTSGSTITANLQVNDGVSTPNCFPNPLVLSGSTSGDAVALTPTPNNSALAIAASIEPGSILLGTYSCTSHGGGADNGTVYGTNVPSLSGSWSGSLYSVTIVPGVGPRYSSMPLTASISQAAKSSSNDFPAGSFALSGTVTLTSSACFSSGSASLTIDPTQSYITGEQVFIFAASADGNTTFNWGSDGNTVSLDNPTTATSMTGNSNYGLSSESCYFVNSKPTALSKS